MKNLYLIIVSGLFLTSCANPSVVKLPLTARVLVATKAAGTPRVRQSQSRRTSAPLTIVNKTLIWDPNPPSDQVTSYKIYEVAPKTGTAGAHWNNIGTATTPRFALNGLLVGSLHIYAVTAVNVAEGPKSFLIYRVTQ